MHDAVGPPRTRRQFLLLGSALGGGLLAAACGGASPAPTAAPKAAEPTKPAAVPAAGAPTAPAASTTAPAAPAATTAPAAAGAAAKPNLKAVPRNRTLTLMHGGVEGIYRDHEIWNPYAIGASHQIGGMLLYEPLAFYSAFADKTIYWLAESHQFSPDYKQLDIKLRSGITWSDGKPFSADDVAYTLNTLKDLGAKVRWGVEVQQFVQEAKAPSPDKVTITFKVPSPKFFFFMSYKYDIGLYPVAKHIFEKEDWTKYLAYDPAKGVPVTTGPWQVMVAFQDQKVLDRRDGWWAARAGLTELPKVERIIYLPFTGETQAAQALITNQIDASLDLRPNTIKTVLVQNPKVTTHVGNQPPYGYVDWWPTGLYFNCEREPFNNADMRWAISYFIDRKQVVEVGYGGAATPSLLPMPSYPALKPFVDSIRDLLERYPTNGFDPARGVELLTKSGYKKGGDGIWAKDGKQLTVEILGRPLFADIGPVINEQLRRQGIVASYIQPPDALDRFRKADYTTAFNGHGGSVSGDPYYTLRLYQSTTAGGTINTTQSNFTRWSNPEFDKIVDEMAIVPPDDQKKLIDLYRKAMEIWLPGLPDAQITEWYHRIPMNTTYWTGWPTKDDPYVNGAYWALTNQLVLNRLKPTQ